VVEIPIPDIRVLLVGMNGEGHGREGPFTEPTELTNGGGEMPDNCGGSGLLTIVTLVITVVTSVAPDRYVVVMIVVSLKGVGVGSGEASESKAVEGTVSALDRPADVTSSDEITGVISGVLVGKVMNWEGGVILSSHSVVPLMTEK
jgi:hypothetical protein